VPVTAIRQDVTYRTPRTERRRRITALGGVGRAQNGTSRRAAPGDQAVTSYACSVPASGTPDHRSERTGCAGSTCSGRPRGIDLASLPVPIRFAAMFSNARSREGTR